MRNLPQQQRPSSSCRSSCSQVKFCRVTIIITYFRLVVAFLSTNPDLSLEYVYLLYLLLYVFKHLLRTPSSCKIFLTNNLLVSYIFLNFYYRRGMCACMKATIECSMSRRKQGPPPLPLPPSEDADNAADKEDGWN